MKQHFIKTATISAIALTTFISHGGGHAAHHGATLSGSEQVQGQNDHDHSPHDHHSHDSTPHDSSAQNGHGSHHDSHHGHGSDGMDPLFHHGSLNISQGDRVPSVTVVVHPDERKGWNLEIQTEHFTFAPEQINQAHQPNYGHGHLYVNGVKITRIYGHWYYIETLAPGTHEITVSLHANGHEVLVHDGEAIAYTTTIDVPAGAE
ncbi:MAG: hypothetical protein F6K16_38235 [Symploca sp. SIO2B6]|nr:hypothetical protein [Symploca sp. SIO2B6]